MEFSPSPPDVELADVESPEPDDPSVCVAPSPLTLPLPLPSELCVSEPDEPSPPLVPLRSSPDRSPDDESPEWLLSLTLAAGCDLSTGTPA